MPTTTETPTLSITTERVGRRTYVRGATYPIWDVLRNAGAHWDAQAKAWWLGDHEKAQAIAAKHAVPVVEAPAPAAGGALAMVLVTGNTYPVKDQLRAMGGRWNGTAKGWEVPASKETEAKALVAAAPAPAPRAAAPQRSSSWRPCGYPGCSPNYCDECDGKGYVSGWGSRRRRW